MGRSGAALLAIPIITPIVGWHDAVGKSRLVLLAEPRPAAARARPTARPRIQADRARPDTAHPTLAAGARWESHFGVLHAARHRADGLAHPRADRHACGCRLKLSCPMIVALSGETIMISRSPVAAFVLAIGVIARAHVQAAEPYPVIHGKTYTFQKIADGIYYAAGGFGSNNVVIVNDTDVLIVDTGTTPAAARAFVADIKMLTDKPIDTVVNTHWHFDHTDGNSIFGSKVAIIATDYVRQQILSHDVLHIEPFLTSQGTAVPAAVADLQRRVAAETDAPRKAELQKQLAREEDIAAQLKEIKPTPPNVTYASKLVLHKGAREIVLMFLGRGHTAGDTVVYLPKERIVCSGDLMDSRPAYMGDGFFDEWIATLDKLKALDFTVDLPGHGVPFTDKGLITAYQSYLRDFIAQGTKLKGMGVTAEEAAKRIDLTAHARDFPTITGVGADLRGTLRLYAWLDAKAAGK
jgi:glyoxylase-like metal-dependent hydrolase (beta-lactamase superfamily II)